MLLCSTAAGTTSPDEKFLPPQLNTAGRIGCIVEATDRETGNAKVYAQYGEQGKPDWIAVMARRTDAKQLFLDCGKWFYDVAEAFPKSK